MRRIAVIGGSGFIGTRLCEKLRQSGHEFCIIDKRESVMFPEKTIVADVRHADHLKKALMGWDTVINLAAEHRDDVQPRSLYDEVNVGGARNVCQAATECGIDKIIFTSSVAVYGFAPPNTGEAGDMAPFNDYGRTKAEAEAVYREWQDRGLDHRSLVIVRPTVVFGERNRGNVYNLLRQIASGKFVMIGSGNNVKSMAYVGNVVAFLESILIEPPGIHVCNYVDKPDMNMNQLVRLAFRSLGKSDKFIPRIPYFLGYGIGGIFDVIARVTGKRFPVSRIRVKKFCATTQFATAAESFGFTSPFTLQEGLVYTLKAEFGAEPVEGPLFYSE